MVPEIKGDVIYITTEERAKNWMWEKDKEKVDKRVQFVSVEDIELIRKNGEIRVPEKCYKDVVLIKHPYQADQYIDLTEVEKLRNQKYVKICEIAQLLGASAIQVKCADKTEEKREFHASGEIGFKEISAKTKVTDKRELKQMCNLEISNEYQGNEKVSLESYNQAKQKAKEYNLDEDDGVKTLLDGRKPDGNLMTSMRITCDLTKAENSALDIACSIDAIPKAFSFSSQYKSIIEKKVTISLEMTVTFPCKMSNNIIDA